MDVELPAVGHLWPHLLLGRTRHPCGITRTWRLQREEFLVSLCPVDNDISSFIHSTVLFLSAFFFFFLRANYSFRLKVELAPRGLC